MEELYIKYGFIRRIENENEDAELVKIEKELGYTLPEDYEYFLRTYEGNEIGIPGQTVILWDLFELIETNTDYQIFEEFGNILAIGSNGGGECIALDFKNENPDVILSPFIVIERAEFIKIGSSFENFLTRLDNGIGWFDNI